MKFPRWISSVCAVTLLLGPPAELHAQKKKSVRPPPPPAPIQPVPASVPAMGEPREDSVSIRISNLDLRSAVQILSQYVDRTVLFSGSGAGTVTLETPQPVPKADVVRLLRGLLESQNFELVADTAARLYRARPHEAVKTASAPAPVNTTGTAARPPTGAPELFMISLQHVRAADVAVTVNALYGRASTSFLDGRQRPTTLSDELRNNQIPPSGAPLPQSVPGVGGRSANLTGDLTIVPDAGANSLLVRANRADFELIEAIVKQLDIRPLQALIEVMIVEVRRNSSLDLGVDAILGNTTVGKNGASITGTVGDGNTPTTSTGLGEFALKVMQLGALDLDARIHVAALRGDVRILSRPVVITANNQQATINVGTQRPFVQVSRTLPTDNSAQDQVVQYKDVGTKLTVRPTISTDGLVQLEVTQEVSSATSEVSFNAPVISTRSVQTQLLIKDGQTVALGGLTDKENDVTQGGFPLLSSIPLLGGLFGRSTRQSTETELFIFLTPRVIRTDDDAAKLAAPMQEKAKRITP